MATISLALEPLWFPFLKLEISLFHQHSWKIGTSSGLLAIAAMAVTHVAGNTFGFVSDCSTRAPTGKLLRQHDLSSPVHFRKENQLRNSA
jgi:hypothetical protein